MTNTDALKFGQILSRTLKLYPFGEATPDTIETWFEILKQFPLEDIAVALNRHVADPDKGGKQPLPSDVIANLRGGSATRSLRAWTMVEKAVRTVGHYRSVCFDDAIINKLIDDMGGWVKLASTETVEDLKFRGLEFQKRYTGLMQTGGVGTDYPPYLPGAAESHNSLANVAVEPPALIGDPAKAQQVLTLGKGSTALRVTSGNMAALTGDVVKKLTVVK
ncbi:DUF6475 domain-containing protein [Paraburkholderia sediminicola]|uniref:DUF6475 domain-containing protein n=1 Tax=Paraburkholderia sediminicola TaxID=458836 RepID=UPI0038B72781